MFFKVKITLGYPKILIVTRKIDKKQKDGVTVTVKLTCDKEWIE